MDFVNLGDGTFSIRNFVTRFGDKMSVYGKSRLGKTLSILDVAQAGSSLSLRGNMGIYGAFSVISFAQLGSAISIRSLLQLGSAASVLDAIAIGSTFSLRSRTQCGHGFLGRERADKNICGFRPVSCKAILNTDRFLN